MTIDEELLELYNKNQKLAAQLLEKQVISLQELEEILLSPLSSASSSQQPKLASVK